MPKKNMVETKYTSEMGFYIDFSYFLSYRNYFHLFWGILKNQL